MPSFLARLEWIKNKGKGDTLVIDNWKTINVRISSELKSNMMTINLENDFGDGEISRTYNNELGSVVGEGAFQIGDKFKIYAKYDEDNTGLDFSDNSVDLVFFGDLKNIKSKVANKSLIQLKCTDRTFIVLNRLGWARYKSKDTASPNGQGWTAPLMVQDVIRQRASSYKPGVSIEQGIYDEEGHITPSIPLIPHLLK